MQRLLEHFQGLLRNAGLNLVVFPALIGLLPMPGGAIFSAPMVKNIGQRHALSGDRLSFINTGTAISGSIGGRCTRVSC